MPGVSLVIQRCVRSSDVGMDRPAASTSQMGRFETEWLATEASLAALADRRPLP